MGTTSDILHYHPTNDYAWSLSQCYIESTCLWKCKPTVPNICLLDRTSDQVKVSNYRLIVGVLALYQFGTSSESKLQDIYYSWYYREPSQEGFFAIRKRTRSDSHLELLENQEDSNTVGSIDIDDTEINHHLRLERNASIATQSSHLSFE